jgi:hyperosmotically inducible protein
MSIQGQIRAAAALAAVVLAAGCAGPGVKSADQVIGDARIETRARSAFIADPAVQASDVKVAARKGDVKLDGRARDTQAASRAEEIVRGIPDVKSVKNEIRVTPS